MPRFILICSALALAGSGAWWGSRPSPAAVSVAARALVVTRAEPDSLLLTTAGVVWAGGQELLLARTSGRVRRLFFVGQQYVHQGDVLAKLHNYNFVIAPRDGFEGPCALTLGQYLTPQTLVTTLSRRRTLLVTCPPDPARPVQVRAGDSVSVWVAARPDRVAAGIVEQPDTAVPPGSWTVLLGPGAPFRIGEQACVRRQLLRAAITTALPKPGELPAR